MRIKRVINPIFYFLFFLYISFPVFLSADETGLFSLSEAWSEAAENNLELQLLKAHIRILETNVRGSKAYAFNPEVLYSQGMDRHFGLEQIIEWPGKASLRRAFAEKDVESARYALSGFEIALEGKIRMAFGELIAARQLANAAEEEAKDAGLVADAAKVRAKKGFLPPNEELKTRVEYVNALSQLQSARLSVELAKTTLNQLLGRPSDQKIPEIYDVFSDIPPDLPLERILSVAMECHPDLRIQQMELQKADAGISSARIGHFPDIGIEVFHEENSDDPDEKKTGFGVTIPLPLWTLKGENVENAKLLKSEAQLVMEKKCSEVRSQVRNAYLKLTGAQKNLSLFSKEILKELESQSRLALERYIAGEFTLSNLAELQLTRRNYLRDYINARLAACRAWCELEEAAGISLEKLK